MRDNWDKRVVYQTDPHSCSGWDGELLIQLIECTSPKGAKCEYDFEVSHYALGPDGTYYNPKTGTYGRDRSSVEREMERYKLGFNPENGAVPNEMFQPRKGES